MGTLLEVRGENPFRCRAYHNAAQALQGLPADLSEMIADGRLAEVPGIGETMLAKIVQLVTTGHLPAYEELRRATPPGLVALLRVPGLGPKKIKALHDDAEDREPGRPPRGGRGGQDRRPQGLRRQDRGEDPRRDPLRRVGGRPDPPEPGAAAGRADPGGGPGPPRSHPRRGLRQPPPPRRDDRRPRHPVQRRGPGAGARPFRQAPRGGHGPGARADQGERPPGRRRPVRPPRGRGRAVPVRAALLHRLEGAQHRDAAAGAGPRPHAQRVRPGRTRRAGRLRRPRPTCSPRSGWPRSPPSCARTPARSRPPRRGPLPRLVDPRRPDRDVPLPHRLERRRRHARRDGRGRPALGLKYLGIADHSPLGAATPAG